MKHSVRPPPTLPGQPEPAVQIRTPRGPLPARARAGVPLRIYLRMNGQNLSLGKVIPRGKRLEIAGEAPSGLLWLRARADDDEIRWKVAWKPGSHGKDAGTARFLGAELAQRVPLGTYHVEVEAGRNSQFSFTCRITPENPVCSREVDLR